MSVLGHGHTVKTTENERKECSLKKNVFFAVQYLTEKKGSAAVLEIHPTIHQEFQVKSGCYFDFSPVLLYHIILFSY